jgi:hypothetical protein
MAQHGFEYAAIGRARAMPPARADRMRRMIAA